MYAEESKDGVYPMASDNGGPGRTALTFGDALYTEGSKDGVYPVAAENGAEGSPALPLPSPRGEVRRAICKDG